MSKTFNVVDMEEVFLEEIDTTFNVVGTCVILSDDWLHPAIHFFQLGDGKILNEVNPLTGVAKVKILSGKDFECKIASTMLLLHLKYTVICTKMTMKLRGNHYNCLSKESGCEARFTIGT